MIRLANGRTVKSHPATAADIAAKADFLVSRTLEAFDGGRGGVNYLEAIRALEYVEDTYGVSTYTARFEVASSRPNAALRLRAIRALRPAL